jgi:Uma2 family endonuclease
MFYFLQARGNATGKSDGGLVPKNTERSPDLAVGNALLRNDPNADQNRGVGNEKNGRKVAGT